MAGPDRRSRLDPADAEAENKAMEQAA